MSPGNPQVPQIEMTVELFEPDTGASDEKLTYRLFLDGEPVKFEHLRGAKRALASALLQMAERDYSRKKSGGGVDPHVIPGPPDMN